MLQGVVHQDASGKVIAMNPAAERILGKTREEFLGSTSVREERDSLREDGSPFPGLEHPAMVALRTGRPLQGVVMGVFNPREGAHRWISIGAVPLFRPGETSPFQVYTVFEDITERKRAEQALRVSEERLRLFVEHAPAAIAMLDRQMQYVAFSRRWVADYELAGEDLIGRTHYDVFPEISERWKEIHRRCLAGAVEKCDEDPFPRADGKLDWVRWEVHPWRNEKGDIEGIIIFSELITERKRAEEALRQSEERYRMLFSTMIEGFCIIEVIFDAEGRPVDYRFLEINPAFEAQTGLKNARGRLMRELAPDHEAHWFEIYGQVALTGQPARFVNEARALNRWYDVSAYRVGGIESRNVAILFNDITASKQAEDALRASEDQFRTLANAIPQLCWMANADGWIFWYNQRWYDYTGATPEQMEGWGWQSVHDPEALPKVLERWKASIATGEPFDMVFPLRGADGVFRPFLTRIMPVRDADGKVARWFGTNTDISEQRKTEEALAASESRFRALLDSTSQGVVAVDESGRMVLGERPDGRDVRIHPRGTARPTLGGHAAGALPDGAWRASAALFRESPYEGNGAWARSLGPFQEWQRISAGDQSQLRRARRIAFGDGPHHGHHRAQEGRGGPAASSEAGEPRVAGRRRRARLQQPAGGRDR